MVGIVTRILMNPVENNHDIDIPKKLTPMDQYNNRHDFGFRKIGDVLIDREIDNWHYQVPQNIEVTFRCTAHQDQIITNADIQIDVNPTSIHNVRIVAGGIGTSFIEILVIAREITWLCYDVRFYGNQSEIQ